MEKEKFYKKIVGNRAFYLKTGIDTETFVPVDDKKKILTCRMCG